MNIPNFTKEQKKENLRLGVANLRKNPRKAFHTMRDDSGGRCCLCVLSDTAEDICGFERGSLSGKTNPTFELDKVFRVTPYQVGGNYSFLLAGRSAEEWNDGSNFYQVVDLSHTEIADMIEKEYL